MNLELLKLYSSADRNRIVLAGIIILVVLCGKQAVAFPTLLYIHDSARNFGTLNVTTGEIDAIGKTSVVLTDIAFDPKGNLFGCSFTGLYQINHATAETTYIGSLGVNNMNALVFGKDGTLLGSGGSTLYHINPMTGNATNVGSIGYGSAGDLAFDKHGTLYLSTTSDKLIKIDPQTGDGILVGPLGFHDVFGLAYGPDYIMYGVSDSDQKVFSINLASGAGTLISEFSGAAFTGAYGASYISEPSMPGDANSDGSVDVSDLGILATNYGITSGAEWGDGDFTGDRKVDVSDLGILATNYGSGTTAQSVPESSTYASLLGLGLAGLLTSSRKKWRMLPRQETSSRATCSTEAMKKPFAVAQGVFNI